MHRLSYRHSRHAEHLKDRELPPLFLSGLQKITFSSNLEEEKKEKRITQTHTDPSLPKLSLLFGLEGCFIFGAHKWKMSKLLQVCVERESAGHYSILHKGLASFPLLFPHYSWNRTSLLHKLGFFSITFTEGTPLTGFTQLECVNNVKASLQLFEKLGIFVHPVQSVLEPSHQTNQWCLAVPVLIQHKQGTTYCTPYWQQCQLSSGVSLCEHPLQRAGHHYIPPPTLLHSSVAFLYSFKMIL